jgi:GPH family glycoside/pentoside/hexuronide:cation symporter
MTTTSLAPAATRVSIRERVAYAGSDLGFNLVYVAIGTYLTFFYTEVAGIPATTVGTIFLAARLLDGVWDLLVGVLMEKLHSRFGKARPWLLYLAIPYGLSAALLFTAPNLGETGKVIYAFVTYTLSAVIIYTAMNVPYGVLNALITKDQVQRGVLNTYRMIAAYAGALIVTGLTMPIVNATGGDAHSWTLAFGLYGILAAALFFITFKFCTERVGVAEHDATVDAEAPAQPVQIGAGVRSLLRNKYWLMLVLFGVLLFTAYSLMGVYPYYAKYALGDEGLSSMMFTFRTVIEFGGVFLALPFIKRIGKRNISLAGCLAIVAGQCVIVLAPTILPVVLVGLGTAGVGVGAMFAVLFAMIGDTIEYEEWRSGIRAEGLVYAGATFGQKVGGAVGGMAVGWLLGFAGYLEGNVDEQPASALHMIDFVFIWLPLIIAVPMALVMLMYRLDNEYPQILEALRQRQS